MVYRQPFDWIALVEGDKEKEREKTAMKLWNVYI